MTLPRIFASPAWCALPAALALLLLSPWIVELSDGSIRWAYHLDADVYREGARALWRGEDIYAGRFEVEDTALPFTYPPFAAFLFTPLALVPGPLAGLLMTAVSVLCLWWVMALVVRSYLVAAWLLPVAALLEPVRDTISFGQINLVLMALVATDALRNKGRVPAGALAGLAAAIKLTPAVFIVFFLVRRDFRAAGTMVLSAVVATLAAAALRPEMSWRYWLDTLSNTGRIGDPEYSTNQSLAGALARLTDPASADRLWLLGAGALLMLLVLAAWRVRHSAVATLAVTSLIALLVSPVSWSHHWVWLVVLVLAFGPTAVQGSGLARWLGGALLLVAIVPPHRLLPMGNGAETEWPWWAQVVGNAYVLGALAVLAVALFAPTVLTGARFAREGVGLSSISLVPQPDRDLRLRGSGSRSAAVNRGRGDRPAEHRNPRQ